MKTTDVQILCGCNGHSDRRCPQRKVEPGRQCAVVVPEDDLFRIVMQLPEFKRRYKVEDRQNNQPEAGGIGADVAEKDASQQGEAMSQEEVAAEFGKATDVLGESVTENIARIAHEVNRAYREAIGEETGPHWNLAPVWQRNSCMDGVRFHVANPDASVAASHEEWLKYKQAAGWAYGPVKDEDEKLHPCVKSFYELPKEQQVKDYLFRAVVHAMRD